MAWHRDHPPPPPEWGKANAEIAQIHAGRAPGAHLAIAYKMALLLIRAYQDGVARVLNFAFNNTSSRTRMTQHLNPDKPIGALLLSRLPAYEPWYRGWVALRDQVKYGAPTGLAQVGGNVGVSFRGHAAREDAAIVVPGDRTIFLHDIAMALRQSSTVAALATEEIAKLLDARGQAALAGHRQV